MMFHKPVGLTAGNEGEGRAETYVCWSRMQAEAGQPLEAIIKRKECERQAGGGLFFWGVGNPASTAIPALARLNIPVPVVFSIMKSRPKAIDVAPTRTFLWRRYFDEFGAERLLPPNAIITSRGDSSSGPKTRHYALMCRSAEPLELRHGRAFDPSAFRNVGKAGGPVGASQVTALLRQVETPSLQSDYEINLEAWLTGAYWVRLSDPCELGTDANHQIATFDGSSRDWLDLAARVRMPQGKILPAAEPNMLLL